MESVAELVEPERLRLLSTRTSLEEGAAIAHSGAVHLTVNHTYEVAARVTTGTALMLVTLKSGLNGLTWSCTCWEALSQPNSPCPHCIAAALVAWEKSSRFHR
jgi:uncharacterized Zn finger protein